MKTKILRKENAITLVALIITIIVLLILAMVSIALVMNSGIITKSKTAVDKYSQEEIQEQIKLAYAEWQTAQWTSDAGDAATFIKNRLKSTFDLQDNEIDVDVENDIVTVTMNEKDYTYDAKAGSLTAEPAVAKAKPGEVVPEGTNAVYKSNGKTAVIPAGYTVSEVTTEQSIDNGLVIKKDGNEWVWIPVSNEDFAAMFGTASDDGWIMSGTTDVKTKYKSNSAIISGVTRVNPGDTSSWREPDVLDIDTFDNNTTNLSAAGLGANRLEMATNLRNDYKAMMDSVKKNGGFYVGRYELSSVGTKKNQPSLIVNWYNLYAACKASSLGTSSVETRMIWGCQWDQVCKFISSGENGVSLTDSTSYGNYKNSTVEGHGSKQVTGYSESWKAKNIYDIAGNCIEWTQEAGSNYMRAYRGGSYGVDGDGNPVTYRSGNNPDCSSDGRSTRPVLYLK